MKQKIFHDFDFIDFWDDCDYSKKEYTEAFPTEQIIASIEKELGYKLPASYIELMQMNNGGLVKKCCFATTKETIWGDDHCEITGIMGLGKDKTYSLCGEFGSQFMIEDWGYPNTGVYICDCPSAGHDMVMLDYEKCGKDGEPQVVHIDQENDYKKTFLAKDFETFIRGLVEEDYFRDKEDQGEKTMI